jgi:ATP-dependent DNA ligase
MTTAQRILQNLDKLAATPKTNDKISLLREMLSEIGNEVFLKYVVLTLDPYTRFYRKNLYDTGDIVCDIDTEKEIDKLYNAKTTEEIKELVRHISYTHDNDTREIFTRMARKDLCCGVGISLVNKAANVKLIEDFKVGKAEEKSALAKLKTPAYSNLKIDGQRAVAIGSSGGDIDVFSSGGNQFKQVQNICDELQCLFFKLENHFNVTDLTIDGEFLMEENGKMVKRTISNGVCNKILNGNATEEELLKMKFFIFDVLPSATALADGGTDIPLYERVEALEKAFAGDESYEFLRLVDYVVVDSIEQAQELNAKLIKDGFEGSIIKEMDSVYKTKRMKNWVKLKGEYQIDVKVHGYTAHSKRDDMIGSLLISSSDDIVSGAVGTGEWLTHDKRIELKQLADDGELIGMILTVTVMEISECKGAKSFYLPRIIEQRFDKTEADSYDKIMSMF